MADGSGLSTALRLLGATGAMPGADGQEDLFGGELAPMPLEQPKGASGPQGGRPTGARNRSTNEWIALFLSKHRAPLDVLGAIYSRPWTELYAELQAAADQQVRVRELAGGGSVEEKVLINPLDVLKFQATAAQALLPYIHKQQPRAVEVTESKRGLVILGDALADAAQTMDDDGPLPLPPSDPTTP